MGTFLLAFASGSRPSYVAVAAVAYYWADVAPLHHSIRVGIGGRYWSARAVVFLETKVKSRKFLMKFRTHRELNPRLIGVLGSKT